MSQSVGMLFMLLGIVLFFDGVLLALGNVSPRHARGRAQRQPTETLVVLLLTSPFGYPFDNRMYLS